MKEINITSGEYLNNYLEKTQDGVFIPFNEAMIEGKLSYPLFDGEFISYRAKVHNVEKSTYALKLGIFLNISNYVNKISKITLWFGKDAFCIINLLTVLAYLENLKYVGKILLNIVDDHTNKVLESNINLEPGEFKNIYLNLCKREFVEIQYDFINIGLKDYLYITSDENYILDYIKKNMNSMSFEELLINVLNITGYYGLGDEQIIKMIKKVKDNK